VEDEDEEVVGVVGRSVRCGAGQESDIIWVADVSSNEERNPAQMENRSEKLVSESRAGKRAGEGKHKRADGPCLALLIHPIHYDLELSTSL
jgi:hypothetical protein